ncbi:MAG TPA: HAMP domain-containing sensor histidine kinase [Candidatus Saccharimonadales bacterium]|nr:HAMP domain-containing sensor histidine kinase [Candidatus Saccharimonadales bacterium]
MKLVQNRILAKLDELGYIESMPVQKIISGILTYFFAVLIAVIALFITLLVDPAIGKTTATLIFLPAIIISAWYGGFYPGVVTTIIAAIEMDYFFLPSYNVFTFTQFVPMIQIVLFILEGFCISFFIDIGKRRDNIKEYRRREKEQAERFLALENKYAQAQEEIQSRDEFLSVASHELKTPLTSMLLQIQTALHNIRSVSLAQFSVEHLLKMLESAENQTKRLSRMINDLLNVSLITTGKMDLELEELDLEEVVKNVLEDFSQKLEKENYEVTLEAAEPVVGQWDKVRIEQAISNLISNAIKYGRKKPIEITLSKRETMGRLVMKDQGIGIPASEAKRIFALFQRAVSPNDYKGLGVGLYITNQIIKAHGGKISVSSKEGKGSTFTLELPLKKSPEEKLFS